MGVFLWVILYLYGIPTAIVLGVIVMARLPIIKRKVDKDDKPE